MSISFSRRLSLTIAIASSLVCANTAYAKVSAEEAAKLGTELTINGANPNANADGSIPAWTGGLKGVPAGFSYKAGETYPDIYGKEKPVLTITADNYLQHSDNLSDGQVALFKAYPQSFKMYVYPTHRDGTYSEIMAKRTHWNATKTRLVGGDDGLTDYTGGIPFVIPQNGAELIWNARLSQPSPVMDATIDDIAVQPNNTQQMRRARLQFESPYAYDNLDIGVVNQDLTPYAGLAFFEVLAPVRQKGEMIMVHEPLNAEEYTRNSWIYMPGARRVRRAPNVGYDTPNGPGGLMTVDDAMGFNGALDRYNWTLVGKKEVYIPYHSYKFDDPSVKYDDLLPPLHVNPEYMRYEKHRVWIAEANLKEGKRHLYTKRRFYIDEDSWQIALVDSFDGKGELWRVGMLNTVYDFLLPGYVTRAQINHDLSSKAYVASRLVNETAPANYFAPVKGEKFYTAQNLRKMGR